MPNLHEDELRVLNGDVAVVLLPRLDPMDQGDRLGSALLLQPGDDGATLRYDLCTAPLPRVTIALSVRWAVHGSPPLMSADRARSCADFRWRLPLEWGMLFQSLESRQLGNGLR